MRALRLLTAVVLCAGVLFVVAPDADAVNKPSTSKACKSLNRLQSDLADVDPSDADSFDADAFEEVGDAFHSAARKAPRQVKSALTTLGDFYEDLSNADSSVEALQEYGRGGEKFSKALTKFSTFYATACTTTATSSSGS